MARPLRYLRPDCPLVEVTCRTIDGRMLLRPSRELKRRILGVLARAADRYEVGVCAFIYLSTHCHLLLRPTNAATLAAFMNYLNSNIARKAGRLHGWREKFWGRRLPTRPDQLRARGADRSPAVSTRPRLQGTPYEHGVPSHPARSP